MTHEKQNYKMRKISFLDWKYWFEYITRKMIENQSNIKRSDFENMNDLINLKFYESVGYTYKLVDF